MSKVKKRGAPPKPKDDTVHLEETLTSVTEEVAKTLQKYRTPLLIGVLVLVGIIALFLIVQKFDQMQTARWNRRMDEILTEKDPAKLRTDAKAFLDEISGKPLEEAFVPKYAAWLRDQDDLKGALQVTKSALERHPDSPELLLAEPQLETLVKDADFKVPSPKPKQTFVGPPAPEESAAPAPKKAPVVSATPKGNAPANPGASVGKDEQSSNATTPPKSATPPAPPKEKAEPPAPTPPSSPPSGNDGGH